MELLSNNYYEKFQGDLNCQFRKVFVGRLSSELTRSDLMDYFSQFGTITDITIPQPFRSFAFITFQESSKPAFNNLNSHI